MKKNQKINYFIITLISLSLIIVSFWSLWSPNSKSNKIEHFLKVNLETDHIKGNPEANLFIIEYSDMECPFCKEYRKTAKEILEIYGHSGEVALVYRHYFDEKIHPSSKTQAIYSECVSFINKNKFFPFIEKIYENSNSDGNFPESKIFQIAIELGIETEELKECFKNNPKAKERVESNVNLAKLNGVKKTPYIIFYTPNILEKVIEYDGLHIKDFELEIQKAITNSYQEN